MRNNTQNSSRWTFETISATICNLPGNVPNNYYFGGFEFGLHKALDFAFRLRNEKNISFFPRLAPRPFFNTNHEFKYFHSLSDFDKNHSWVKISRSDDINSARRRQALIFDANLCPVLKWVYWQMNCQKAINVHTWGAQGNVSRPGGAGNGLWSCRFSAFHDRPS